MSAPAPAPRPESVTSRMLMTGFRTREAAVRNLQKAARQLASVGHLDHCLVVLKVARDVVADMAARTEATIKASADRS